MVTVSVAFNEAVGKVISMNPPPPPPPPPEAAESVA
jgi:hypothetical protein